MAFDFEKLMQDPTFQFGLSLLSNSRQPGSMGQAFGVMQKTQAMQQQKAQQEAMLAQQQQFEDAKTAHMSEQEKIAQQNADRASKIEERRALIEERQQAQAEALMRQLGMPPQAQAAQPMQAPTAASATGITPQLLDNLRQVESGGNPHAIGPAIPGTSERAMGAYQFLPSTIKMLKDAGHTFNPLDEGQSRGAAEKYLGMLMQQNGGDLQKAIAAYGGFKTKDPSAYIQKVMGGAQPPAGAAATPVPAQPTQSGLDVARMGALAGLTGMKGANGIIELGKMMQPQNVPAGGYQRGADGSMNFVPDPYREQTLKNETTRTANDTARTTDEQAKTAAALADKATKAKAQRADTEAAVRGVTNGMKRMEDNVDALLTHPGLGYNTGWAGALGVPKVPGSAAHDASVLLEGLKSKLVVNTMMDLKNASKTGSTGFGQLSEKEGMRLETYVQNLDRAQTLPAMKKALSDLKTFSQQSRKSYETKLNDTYGTSAAKPALPGGWKMVE